MNVKENIGIVNALIRITVGLTLLALGAAKLSRNALAEYLFICDDVRGDEGGRRNCPLLSHYCPAAKRRLLHPVKLQKQPIKQSERSENRFRCAIGL